MINICGNFYLRKRLRNRDNRRNVYNILRIGIPHQYGGKIYTIESVKQVIDSFHEKENVMGFISLDMTYTYNDNQHSPSHSVNNLWIEGDTLKAEISVLNNENGKILQNLLDLDIIHFSMVCLGSIQFDNTVNVSEFLCLNAVNKNLCGYHFID